MTEGISLLHFLPPVNQDRYIRAMRMMKKAEKEDKLKERKSYNEELVHVIIVFEHGQCFLLVGLDTLSNGVDVVVDSLFILGSLQQLLGERLFFAVQQEHSIHSANLSIKSRISGCVKYHSADDFL